MMYDIYESRCKPMYRAKVFVGLDSEFLVKAHLLIPADKNIMCSCMLIFYFCLKRM